MACCCGGAMSVEGTPLCSITIFSSTDGSNYSGSCCLRPDTCAFVSACSLRGISIEMSFPTVLAKQCVIFWGKGQQGSASMCQVSLSAACLYLQKQRKPAYIEICCNLAGLKHPSFTDPPVPIQVSYLRTNDSSLAEAVKATAEVTRDVMLHPAFVLHVADYVPVGQVTNSARSGVIHQDKQLQSSRSSQSNSQR